MRTISPEQFNNLPKPFQDKIKIDEGVSKMRRRKVIDFPYGRKLVLMQQNIRLRCAALIKRNRGGGSATTA